MIPENLFFEINHEESNFTNLKWHSY